MPYPQARVLTHHLKLHASPAMGEGPTLCELPMGSLVEIIGPDVGQRDDPVCFPAQTMMDVQQGYVSAKNIRFEP